MPRSISATIVLSAITIAALGDTNTSAQSIETGFLNRTILLDGTEYRYQIYVPREFPRDKSWPVILSLHGGGGMGAMDSFKLPTVCQTPSGDMLSAFRPSLCSRKAMQMGRQAGKNKGKAALAELDQAIIEFSGDRSRVYLTGASAGGNGSWYLAFQCPERFAFVMAQVLP